MNSDIRYLQQLEEDLREAAESERELDAEAAAGAGRGRSGSGPRRLPRRGWNWGTAAAAIVALLVVAGGIGFLTRPKGSSSPTVEAAGGANLHGVATPQQQKLAGLQPNIPSSATLPEASPAPAFRDVAQGTAATGFAGNDSVGSGGTGVGSASGTGVKADSLAGTPTDLSKIERDGQIGILIPDKSFSRHVAAVSYIATSSGGMVLSSDTQNEKTGTFTLRIPASHFENAMLRLRAMGTVTGAQILYQDSTGQDVTAQFVDLKARLQIVQGTKARLVSLQSKATTTSQILFLGNQIDQVQLQLEQLQGNINYINNQVAESTIRVELREKDAPATTNANNTVKQPSLRSAWSRSLQGFLLVIGAVIVGLGFLIPIALIALGVWFVIMLVRRQRRATSSAP